MSAWTRRPLTRLVIHPTTGDRCEAEADAADTAARTLRREATEHGCNPRTRCLIVRQTTEEHHAN